MNDNDKETRQTMTTHTEINPHDVMDVDAYAAVRSARRAEMIALKKNRRLNVGPALTFYFESYATMLYQVQEMMHTERGGEEQLKDELAAFNPLVPKGRELVATVMLEYGDPDVRARELLKLGGIEEHIKIEIGDQVIKATWEDDVERTTADGKTSAVHFLHFPFTDEQIEMFKAGDERIVIVCDHPNYGHMAIISDEMRRTLVEDFA